MQTPRAQPIPHRDIGPSVRIPALNAAPNLTQALTAMGGDHGGGHAGGDFRQKVWSMTGGPYCRPVHWRRNTAIAMFGVFLICIPIAMKSAELEVCMCIPITQTLTLRSLLGVHGLQDLSLCLIYPRY